MDNLVTSNIRQRPIRTLVSVAGVALGVSLVMLFTGLARGMANDLQRRATNVRAELIFMRPGAIQLTSTTANLDTRYVERLKQIDGVDWNIYSSMNGINMIAGHGPQNVNEIVIDEIKARNSNLRLGDPFKPFGTDVYSVAGIYSPESGARVKMSL